MYKMHFYEYSLVCEVRKQIKAVAEDTKVMTQDWVRVKRGNGKTETEKRKRKSGKKGKRRKSGKKGKRRKSGKKGKRRKKG